MINDNIIMELNYAQWLWSTIHFQVTGSFKRHLKTETADHSSPLRQINQLWGENLIYCCLFIIWSGMPWEPRRKQLFHTICLSHIRCCLSKAKQHELARTFILSVPSGKVYCLVLLLRVIKHCSNFSFSIQPWTTHFQNFSSAEWQPKEAKPPSTDNLSPGLHRRSSYLETSSWRVSTMNGETWQRCLEGNPEEVCVDGIRLDNKSMHHGRKTQKILLCHKLLIIIIFSKIFFLSRRGVGVKKRR